MAGKKDRRDAMVDYQVAARVLTYDTDKNGCVVSLTKEQVESAALCRRQHNRL